MEQHALRQDADTQGWDSSYLAVAVRTSAVDTPDPKPLPGTYNKVQITSTPRRTELTALAKIAAAAIFTLPKLRLAGLYEREGMMTIRDREGRIKRRGLSGAALLEYVAKRMRAAGYKDMCARDVDRALRALSENEALRANGHIV